MRCGIFNKYFARESDSERNLKNRARINRVTAMSLVSRFFGTPCTVYIDWRWLCGSLTNLKNEIISEMTNRQGFRNRLAEPRWSHISECGLRLHTIISVFLHVAFSRFRKKNLNACSFRDSSVNSA